MTKKASKQNISSLNVLKTLQVLLDGSYTMNELIDILNATEDETIFNNSIVSKYINTCRMCGIEIPKIQNKYYVAKIPFGMELSNEEIDLLEILQDIAHQEMSSVEFTMFDNLIEKINKYSNKKLTNIQNEQKHTSFELFERAITNKHKVKLMFKNQAEIIGIPIKIIDAKNKSFFYIYTNGRNRMIDVNRLSGIQETNERFIQTFSDQTVVFELKGALAKRYAHRENETIELNNNGTITVINRGENKEVLLSRLLRYDNQCKILSPKSYKEDFKAIIDQTLKNYGVA